ncbi:LOW QUALITY PROTEIN: abnormal spindle-like microcephaly-associated protein homolog [Macrobrachium nipponense]|uniref:LOW QUALITY PROTEIN: abnormal spindle-like microcephaly-associated protein homolog n=1 Tax=Macrobrachium nipponense TaxID=159736 RepID=UPI0030C8B996
MASLADFSFVPGDDPRRCSTGVKSLPPDELTHQRKLSEKGRQLFADGPAGDCKSSQGEPDAYHVQELSTIVEVEEATFAMPLNKTHDVLLNKTKTLFRHDNQGIPDHLDKNTHTSATETSTKEDGLLTSLEKQKQLAGKNKRVSILLDSDTVGRNVAHSDDLCDTSLKKNDNHDISNIHCPSSSVTEINDATFEKVQTLETVKCSTESSINIESCQESALKVVSERNPCSSSSASPNTTSSQVATERVVHVDSKAAEHDEEKSKKQGLIFIELPSSPPKKSSDNNARKPGSRRNVEVMPGVSVNISALKTRSNRVSHASKTSVVSSKISTQKSPGKDNNITASMKPPKSFGIQRDTKMQTKSSSSRSGLQKSSSNPRLGQRPHSMASSRAKCSVRGSASTSNLSGIDQSNGKRNSRNTSSTVDITMSLPHLAKDSSDSSLDTSSVNCSTSTSKMSNTSIEDRRRTVFKKSLGIRAAPSQLTLIKSSKTSIVHHPNPFAAKNVYYDSRWIDKQILGFTKWLNFILTPPEEEDVAEAMKKVDMGKLWTEATKRIQVQQAPTKEVLSLRAYTVARRLNRLRRKACRLFQSDKIVETVFKLEVAIDKKLIRIRDDRMSHADMELKQRLLTLVLCYNPFWLRIGLETIYGELLFLNSNSDIAGLTHFIITRLIANPDIAAKYAHPSVPHSYRAGYDEAIKTFQLKKFLLVVLFLDHAKTERLIDHDPCLFNKEAPYKSSRDILIAFARDFLSGVGDITKHLGYLGYVVKHKQTHLDEFDFAVTNLAVDLRCGLRLTRVLEMLTQKYTLCSKLRVPAISRLQKLHNTEIALDTLESSGCPGVKQKFPAKDIVDGHREKTLGLLWTIIFKFQVSLVISETRIFEEIVYLMRSLKVRAQLDPTARTGLQFVLEAPNELERIKSLSDPMERILGYLKLWAQYTCAHYGVEIENLTVSFSDGRALCLLVYHYFPDLLPIDLINWQTTQNLPTQEANPNVSVDDSFSEETYTDTCTKEEYNRRLALEKENFGVFIDKISKLDRIPMLIKVSDMVNTIPDEKVTSTFLSYLCARLLDLSEEVKAARIIQMAWRKYLAAKRLEELKVKTAQAIIIQRWWRSVWKAKQRELYAKAAVVLQANWRRKRAQLLLQRLREQKERERKDNAARTIQRVYRRYSALKYLQQSEAAQTIQRMWKTYVTRKQFLRERCAAVKIQAYFRSWKCRRQFLLTKRTIVKIQRDYRQKLLVRRLKHEYSRKREAIVLLQSWWRVYLARRRAREIAREKRAACIIQNYLRMCQQRNRFLRTRQSVVVLQKHTRKMLCQQKFRKMYSAVLMLQRWWRTVQMSRMIKEQFTELRIVTIKLQSHIRMYLVRKRFIRIKSAVLTIQRHYKMVKQRQEYNKIRTGALVIQSWWRSTKLMHSERVNYIQCRNAAIKIQSAFRGYIARKTLKKSVLAALKIQTFYRTQRQRKQYLRQRQAVLTVQRYIRAWSMKEKEKRRFNELKAAAVIIQSNWRGRQAKRKYLKAKHSATVIQAWYRGQKIYHSFCNKKAAAVTIQRSLRSRNLMMQKRREYLSMRQNIIRIQSAVRCWLQRSRYKKVQAAVVCLQRRYCALKQMRKQRQDYLLLKKACVIVQSNYRMKRQRDLYEKKRQAALFIQMWYRTCKVSQKEQSIFKSKREACILIQKSWRMHSQRLKYQRIRQACISIQHRYRAHKLGVSVRNEYIKKQMACITLQSWVRMVVTRKKFLTLKKSAICIQRHVRARNVGMKCQQEYQELKAGAIKLQSLYRMRKQRREYLHLKSAAVTLQEHFRAHMKMQAVRSAYIVKKNAAVTIQSKVRMWLTQREYARKREACVRIQAWFRCVQACRCYLAQRNSVLIIQKYFRAYLLQRKAQRQYVTTRKAVITLQAAFKGYLTRKNLREKHRAATVIQKRFRGLKMRNAYLTKLRAISVLQCSLRNYLIGKKTRKDYLEKRSAAVAIQACVRGHIVRKRVQEMNNAAVVIQKTWRMYYICKGFQKKKKAIVTIQRAYLSYLLTKAVMCEYKKSYSCVVKSQAIVRGFLVRQCMKKQMYSATCIQAYFRSYCVSKQYVLKRKAAIKLQAAARGFLVRKALRQQRDAAVAIQSSFRRWRECRKYKEICNSVLVIQTHWRATLLMRETLTNYHTIKGAVLVIQSACRGWIARKHILKQHRAATVIQAHVRGLSQYRKYAQLKFNTVHIQRWWRNIQLGSKVQENYVLKKKSAIIIQSYFRKYTARKRYKESHTSATKIQSFYRAYRQRQIYIKQKQSVEIIQVWWKSYLRMQHEKREYDRFRQAVILLQAGVRGMKARREMKMRHEAAAKIQARFREWLARRRYSQIRQSIIKLQAHARGLLVRKQIEVQHKAAVVIQSRFRGYRMRRDFRLLYSSAVYLQRWWRSITEIRKQQKEFKRAKDSVVRLQAHIRGMLVRRKESRQKQAATVIQSYVRRWIVSRSYHQRVLAAIQIQRWYRSLKKAKYQQSKYQSLRKATVLIQASYKGFVVRKNIAEQRAAQVKIASHFRGWQVRKTIKFQQTVRSAKIIQTWWRATSLAREQQSQYCRVKKATILIQSYTRGMIARSDMKKKHRAALTIQSCIRGWLQRRKYIRLCHSVTKIQSFVKCYQARRRFLLRKEKAIVVQKWWRGLTETRRQVEGYREIRQAVVILQASVRGMKVRREIRKQCAAAVKIQSYVRRWLICRKYTKQTHSVIKIQKWWRSIVMTRSLSAEYRQKKEAAVVLQAYARGMMIRRSFVQQRAAAIKIQSWVRCWLLRRQYKARMTAVVKLQRYWRGAYLTLRTQEQFIYMRRGAVILQAAWRGRQVRKQVKRLKAARCIQAHVRGWQVRKRLRERRSASLQRIVRVTKIHMSAIVIQRCYRRYVTRKIMQRNITHLVKIQRWVRAKLERSRFLKKQASAVIIQRAWRKKMEERKERRRNQAALTIQSAWRGRFTRQSLGGKKLEEIRKRLAVATHDATDSKRIGYKTECAINFLLMYKDLKRLLIAVMYLDTSTRWSPPCCVKLTESGALKSLVFILRTSNRSVPHMDIISNVLDVFINLSKYHTTAQAVHTLDGLFPSIIQLMTIYYEKCPDIFCKCCTLLYVFATSSPPHQEMASAKVKENLSSLKSLMIRKENASRRGQRPIKYVPLPPSQLPSLKPDWFLRGNRSRQFNNPIVAIVTLLARLEGNA